MERVFLLVNEWVFDGEDDVDIDVYETFDQAQTKMKELMKEAISDFKSSEVDYDKDDYCEGDMSWSIWEDGRYSANHTTLMIVEKDIIKEE